MRARIEEFIANRSDVAELHELLLECMNNATVEGLTAVRPLYEDMYGGFTFNFELKAPAASCLVFWGEADLRALVEGATATPASKNVSLCVQLLSTVASGRPLSELSFIRDSRIAEKIQIEHAKLDRIGEIARILLTQFVLSQESDDEVAFIGGRLSMVVEDMGPA